MDLKEQNRALNHCTTMSIFHFYFVLSQTFFVCTDVMQPWKPLWFTMLLSLRSTKQAESGVWTHLLIVVTAGVANASPEKMLLVGELLTIKKNLLSMLGHWFHTCCIRFRGEQKSPSLNRAFSCGYKSRPPSKSKIPITTKARNTVRLTGKHRPWGRKVSFHLHSKAHDTSLGRTYHIEFLFDICLFHITWTSFSGKNVK